MTDAALHAIGTIEHSLHCRIELPLEDMRDVLIHIDDYNEFTGEKAIRIINETRRMLGANDEKGMRVSIGREGSMVLYIQYLERQHGNDKALDSDELKQIFAFANAQSADEADRVSNPKDPIQELRFWWD